MTEVCPKEGCNHESPGMSGLGVHWALAHDEIPPWKRQTCDWCGEDFEKCDSQMTEEGSYCSEACYGKHLSERITGEQNPHYKGGRQTFTCDQCGESFRKYPADRRSGHVFCEYACFEKWETIHGESRNYGPDWDEIRQAVIERDGGTCTFDGCDKRECEDGRSLHVHHIEPFVHFDKVEEANRLENLRTLCAKHHRAVETN